MKSVAIGLLALASVILPILPQEKSETRKIQDSIPVPDEAAVERRDFMRTKLMYTQNIFEGLTTRDFELIRRGIADVEQVMEAAEWVTIDNDQYRQLTDEFKTALHRLKITAESKNIDATALRFYELSTRCIDCHQHLRHAKYAF